MGFVRSMQWFIVVSSGPIWWFRWAERTNLSHWQALQTGELDGPRAKSFGAASTTPKDANGPVICMWKFFEILAATHNAGTEDAHDMFIDIYAYLWISSIDFMCRFGCLSLCDSIAWARVVYSVHVISLAETCGSLAKNFAKHSICCSIRSALLRCMTSCLDLSQGFVGIHLLLAVVRSSSTKEIKGMSIQN